MTKSNVSQRVNFVEATITLRVLYKKVKKGIGWMSYKFDRVEVGNKVIPKFRNYHLSEVTSSTVDECYSGHSQSMLHILVDRNTHLKSNGKQLS